jgi:hypothetical protein
MSTDGGGIQHLFWGILATSSLMLWALPLHGAMWMLRRRSQSKLVWLKAAAISLLGWAILFVLVAGVVLISYCEHCANPQSDLIEVSIFFVACCAAHYALYRTWRERPSDLEAP